MFLRFGKHDRFTEHTSRKSVLKRNLAALTDQATVKRGRLWKYVAEQMPRISALAHWSLERHREWDHYLPVLKNGRRQRHRHLLLKEFTYVMPAKGVGMFTARGIEGSNLRLTLDVDGEGMWRCRFGEYANLSGLPLQYHDGYPEATRCETCEKNGKLVLCGICSRWTCSRCVATCNECQHVFCSNCDQSFCDVSHPAHVWYFHRQRVSD